MQFSSRSDEWVVGANGRMMALHGIGAARDRPEWRTEADDVITMVIDGLARKP